MRLFKGKLFGKYLDHKSHTEWYKYFGHEHSLKNDVYLLI